MGASDTLAVVLVLVIFIALAVLSIRIVPPGERLVVYRLGKTSAILIRGYAGRSARYLVLVIPVVDRVARVEGDIVEPWDDLRDALPEGWVVRRPAEDSTRAAWLVRAQGPTGDEVEGAGRTQGEALEELARKFEMQALSAP